MWQIWSKQRSTFPIRKLLVVAANFVDPNVNVVDEATVTYIDKDGVEFTISTDEELEDAILQYIRESQKKSLLIKVTVPKDECMLCGPIIVRKVGKEAVLGKSNSWQIVLFASLMIFRTLTNLDVDEYLIPTRLVVLKLKIDNGGDGKLCWICSCVCKFECLKSSSSFCLLCLWICAVNILS